MGAALKFKKEAGTEYENAAFIPYSAHITKSVIRLKSGDYISILRLSGAAHESADVIDINSWHDQLNNFKRNISSPNVALWSHVVRRRYNEYPAGEFSNDFCRRLNEKYRERMTQNDMLVNELYITLIYRPNPNKAGQLLNVFNKSNKREQIEAQQDALEVMEELQNTALSALDRYEPEVLGLYEYNGYMYSEMMEFLGYLVNGEWHRMPLPRANISEVLSMSRPFFGKGGLMSLKTPTDIQYCGLLTIQEYPAMTCPGILNDLLSMPFELVIGQSFTFLSKPAALGRMKRQQSRMVNAGDVAESQIAAIDEALDDLSSNRFVMGTHSLAILVRAEDQKELNRNIGDAGSALSDSGMKWAREDVGIAGAFYSLLPGNFDNRIRAGDITSRNFAGFASLHNYPIGRIRGNQWGDAVTMFQTASGSPFYFNFHKGETDASAKQAAKLDPNHKDLANTVVIGKSGTGKTVLEGMLLAQSQKFHDPANGNPLTCIVFDKDLGASVAVRAMGGRYYPLKNGVASGFNPMQLEPTPNNITFLEQFIHLLVRNEELPITPRQEQEISQAIRGVMAVSREKRRLSALLEFFDPTDDSGVYIRLKKWCAGGHLDWLFDNPEDTLVIDDRQIIGFDVTEFLENDVTRGATIFYLMHRIESLIDGRRLQIYMDEFWKLLDDPIFEDFIKNKLVTIRKQDGFLIMFTQSPQQVLKSEIAFAIIGQTATKIFLPNPEADKKDYIEGFKLTHREYEIVKEFGERSRLFLIKQGHNSAVATLNLRGFDDELAVLSGNTATSALAEKLVKEKGEDPANWLADFHRIRLGG